MLLENLSFTTATYLRLERYVNKGSPSGFTTQHDTSANTRARSPAANFHLSAVEFPPQAVITDLGVVPDFFRRWQMLVHPDMIEDPLFAGCPQIDRGALRVVPTASSRTVLALDADGWFLKLTYKGLLGRHNRQIAMPQAQAAIEVSNCIAAAIDAGVLSSAFYFMREVFARIVAIPQDNSFVDWGIVLREPTAYPRRANIAFLLPAFSLFSADSMRPGDPTILTQLIQRQTKSVEDYLFEDIVRPLCDAYFSLLIRCGLQLEAHAQNILFAMDSEGGISGVVARDAESIDRDLSLMADLGLPNPFTPNPYKQIVRADYNYTVMHSFMFDFKFGEYLLTPLIDNVRANFQIDQIRLVDRIRQHTRPLINQLPPDFFPSDGGWYSYANVVHDPLQRREYIRHDPPKYR